MIENSFLFFIFLFFFAVVDWRKLVARNALHSQFSWNAAKMSTTLPKYFF